MKQSLLGGRLGLAIESLIICPELVRNLLPLSILTSIYLYSPSLGMTPVHFHLLNSEALCRWLLTFVFEERIRLLVHILWKLRTSHGITARKLKAADQPIRRQILPVERLAILDEVYQVREEEEKFLDGVTGMSMEDPMLYSQQN